MNIYIYIYIYIYNIYLHNEYFMTRFAKRDLIHAQFQDRLFTTIINTATACVFNATEG